MNHIAPDMVLDKPAIDVDGASLGRIVDVGLFDHSRVKFLVVEDDEHRVPVRTVRVENIADVGAEYVRIRVMGG